MIPGTNRNTRINSTQSQPPTHPTIEIEHDTNQPLTVDKATNNAAAHVLPSSTNAPQHQPNPLSSHAVQATPVPTSPAELFKNHVESEKSRQEGDLETAESRMKEYERDISNLTIKRVALGIIATAAVIAIIGSAVTIAFICPPVGAALAVGLAFGTTAAVCLVISTAIIIDPQDPEIPEDKREGLKKNLENLNTALKLFEKYPKDRVNPGGSSYEEFLDTLPALTKDGVRSYELQHLDKYNNLFNKELKLQKFNDFDRIKGEVQSTKIKLKDLGVSEPFNTLSIQNRINELGVNSIPENVEKGASISKLEAELYTLEAKSKEANEIYINNTKSAIETEIKTDRDALEKEIREKQKQLDAEQPKREIDNLTKELKTAKQAYIAQGNSQSFEDLTATIEKKERELQKETKELNQLEEQVNTLIQSNPKLERTPSLTEAEINNNMTRLDEAIVEIKSKLAKPSEAKDQLPKDVIILEDSSKSLEDLLREKEFEENTLKIINKNAQINQMTVTKNQLTAEIGGLKSILANKNKINEIETKIFLVENAKQIQELNSKSEQLEVKIGELKRQADALYDNYDRTHHSTNIHSNIEALKNRIQLTKNQVKTGNIKSANEELKKLEPSMQMLSQEAAYKHAVKNQFATFRTNHLALSSEEKKKRLNAWQKTEEYIYYATETVKINKLIEEENEKLKKPEHSAFQNSLENFTEIKKLQNFKNIILSASERYFVELGGKVDPVVPKK